MLELCQRLFSLGQSFVEIGRVNRNVSFENRIVGETLLKEPLQALVALDCRIDWNIANKDGVVSGHGFLEKAMANVDIPFKFWNQARTTV